MSCSSTRDMREQHPMQDQAWCSNVKDQGYRNSNKSYGTFQESLLEATHPTASRYRDNLQSSYIQSHPTLESHVCTLNLSMGYQTIC